MSLGALLDSWAAPRICQIHREIAAPILPVGGVPQGGPCSPRALVCALSAWCPVANKLLYMDDRTLAAMGADAQHKLTQALQYTTNFDTSVGLVEAFGQ